MLLKQSTEFPLKVYYIMRYPSRKWILSENLFKTKIAQPKKVLSISDVINMTKNMSDCKKDLSIFTKESIEKRTIGQS